MELSTQNVWDEVISSIQTKISKPSYETWLKETKLHHIDQNHLIIQVPNVFVRDWLENHYMELISYACQERLGKKFSCSFILPEQVNGNEIDEDPEEHQATGIRSSLGGLAKLPVLNNLNPKYTFESFVIGTANRFAHAASLAVAEAPSKAYNPLFIYGGVGLGKTHLLHAIGHFVNRQSEKKQVLYITSEKFTNEFINSIRDNKTEAFRNKYRNIDVLLIDDIQFLAGKEQTQEEFFHTFNTLYEADKQIVISSDRPPKEIPTLEDRLRSRFEWGLITDIQPPDLETRIAILRKKARAEHLEIPNDVIVFIASSINTNIRELEGALIRMIAYSSLVNQDPTVELANEALKNILSHASARAVNIAQIQQIVSDHFGIKVDEMCSKKRTKNIVLPRQVAMYLCRELTDASLPKIGQEFGGRDHTTVLHAYDKLSRLLEQDNEMQRTVRLLKDKIKGSR